jgi:hypothetical protein
MALKRVPINEAKFSRMLAVIKLLKKFFAFVNL